MSTESISIYDKIIDYLSQKNNPDEKLWIDNWRKESEKNERRFQQIKKIWEGETISVGNQQKAWQKVHQQLNKGRLVHLRSHVFRISVAATLLILIASGWFLNHSAHDMVSISTNDNTFIKDTLKDGSIVYLYPSSKLELKNEKKLNYNKELKLQGEAFFVVNSSPDKEMIIHVGDAAIKVKGTSFRVNADTTGEISVIVESGAVELSSPKSNGKKLMVKAGEQGYYSSQQNQIWKQKKNENIYLIYQPTPMN